MEKIIDFIQRVQEHVRATDSLMDGIRHNQFVSHPIPFFGPLDSAIAATVAMNPSSTEFTPERNWSARITATELCNRLIGYFEFAATPPHVWFAESEKPLRPLGLTYAANLVHLDIVPRATRRIQEGDSFSFGRLAEVDAWVFFEALSLASSVRLVILSGTVLRSHYMDEWVHQRASKYGWDFVADQSRLGRPGVGYHELRRAGRSVTVFFTSVSRNARTIEKRTEYTKNISDAATRLRWILK